MIACTSGCTIDREHLADCTCIGDGHQHDPDRCEQCDGCLPKPAQDGSHACRACENRTRDRLETIADLWVGLAERPRLVGIATYGASGGDPEACPDCDHGRPCPRRHREAPTPINPGAVTARSMIRAHLATWCDVLATKHSITCPSEREIVAVTRSIARYESVQSSAHRLGSAILSQPRWDPSLRRDLPPDPAAARHYKAEEYRHAKAAAQARADRETGRDIVAALAEHVARHLERLLADEDDAPVVVADIKQAVNLGRRYAPRGRSVSIRFPCPSCGAQVRLDMDARNDVACRSCGERGDVNWWVGQQPAMGEEPMTLTQIRDFLLIHHGRDIPLDTLRTWSKPRGGPDSDPILPETGRNMRGHKLYDPLKAVAIIDQRVKPQHSVR